MLANLYLQGAFVVDVPMPARYGNETSNLSMQHAALEFPLKLLATLGRRLWLKYFLYDFSMMSIYLMSGIPLILFGLIFGIVKWIKYAGLGSPCAHRHGDPSHPGPDPGDPDPALRHRDRHELGAAPAADRGAGLAAAEARRETSLCQFGGAQYTFLMDALPYLPGTRPANPGLLSRFLPPLEEGTAAAWLTGRIPPGSWILDPFGSSPRLVLEMARAGYRVLVTAYNPIVRFLIEMAASAPAEADLTAALAELAASRKSDERLETHLQSLYLTRCEKCGEQVQARAFLWNKDD